MGKNTVKCVVKHGQTRIQMLMISGMFARTAKTVREHKENLVLKII